MRNTLTIGDARAWAAGLPDRSIQTIVTSPPYFGLRAYLPADHPDKAAEMGAEATPGEYVAALVGLFRALRRALRDDGVLWLNLGDSYSNLGGAGAQGRGDRADRAFTAEGLPRRGEALGEKQLLGIPWRVALALQDDGWVLRSDCIWHKPNPMPESVTDRPTRSHEHLFLLAKRATYFYDAQAIAEPLTRPDEASRATPAKFGGAVKFAGAKEQSRLHSGNAYTGTATGTRNKRDVWTVASSPFLGSHFATFPPDLVRPCVRAGSRPGDLVADPFMGSGTVAQVCVEEGRDWVGCDLDERARGWLAGRLAKLPVRRLDAAAD